MQVNLKNVTKKFNDFKAVNNFTLTFEEGELICLLGPSGCGKSTLLNMISGIIPVTEGKIFFDDRDVTNLAPQHREIGLVFQNYALYPHMSVLENISFPLEIKKVEKKEREALAVEMAKLVKVDTLLDRKPAELSGGQQQRVAIARALIKKPKILLLDEPLSNLDARLRLEMREEIRRIQQETKVTTIFVTHDQEEAMSISDKIILMKDGVLMQVDKPQVLYDNPLKEFVSTFLGNPPINTIKGNYNNGFFEYNNQKIKLNYHTNEEITLAIRPEAIDFDEENYDFKAVIKERFKIGKEELLMLQFDDLLLRTYATDELNKNVGDEIGLKLKNKGVFIFDNKGDRK